MIILIVDLSRSPKEKRSREADHRIEDKSILHPLKVGQLSSRDRKPMHNNCVDKVPLEGHSLGSSFAKFV